MKISHKLVSIIIALAFLVLIQSYSGIFRIVVPVMAIYIGAVGVYNSTYLKARKSFTPWSWLRMLIFLAALTGIYFVLPDGFWRGIFLIASVGLIYFSEDRLLAASEQLVFMQALVSFFGLSLVIFALNFYFLPKNTVTLLLILLSAFAVSRSSFDYIPVEAGKKNFYSLFIAFAVLELAWGLIFLPFYYSALAIIIFNIFYVLWIVIYHHLFNNLSRQKISYHIVFSFILIVLALVTTPWRV
ncbi:hypothetical protein KGQ24_03830 [Patescibacteria group bacterium]|nr:hypothetical protein [Patescibacteria group bacterium]